MKLLQLGAVALAIVLATEGSAARAADYVLEPLAEGPAPGDLSEAVAAAIAPQGFVVKKGARTLCEIWPAAEWTVVDGFTPTASLLYPFQVGQLLGVAHYKSTGEDFRGQEIASGWYTIRYAQQPEDGNHVGTSDTRDFLVLLPAAEDTSAEQLPTEQLIELSKQAAQSNHPCMLALLRAEPDSGAEPTLRFDENRELWSVQLQGNVAGAAGTVLPLEMVVVGKFPE